MGRGEPEKKLFVWEPPLRRTPHFDGYPIVLVRLDAISAEGLREVVTEAWLVRK